MIPALLTIGGLLTLVATIVLLIASFRVSLVWGLVSLLVPFGLLVFAAVHWRAARHGIVLQLAAIPFLVGGIVLAAQQDNEQLSRILAGNFDLHPAPAPAPSATPPSEPAPPPPPPPLPAEIFQARWEANQRRFTELATTYTRLTARRTMLNTARPEAVRTFNDEVALYVADLATAQKEKKQLEAQRPAY